MTETTNSTLIDLECPICGERHDAGFSDRARERAVRTDSGVASHAERGRHANHDSVGEWRADDGSFLPPWHPPTDRPDRDPLPEQ